REKQTRLTAGAGCGFDPVPVQESFVAASMCDVGFDRVQMNRAIRHEIVEVIHDHRLGQYRKIFEGRRVRSSMEPLIKWRLSVGKVAQASTRARLIALQAWTIPPLTPVELSPRAKDVPRKSSIHRGLPFIGRAAARPRLACARCAARFHDSTSQH